MTVSAADRRTRLNNHEFSLKPDFSNGRCDDPRLGMTILNSAYDKVTRQLLAVQKELQNHEDVTMKLYMLKGMLMEEGLRSKNKTYIWPDHPSDLKTFYETALQIYDDKWN